MGDLEASLRRAGLRVTAPRIAVLRVLAERQDHMTVEQIIQRVRAAGVPISTQAAYDVTEALHHTGLAGRIQLPGRPARYEARTGDNHHHLVCRTCGVIGDVDCARPSRPCLLPVDDLGFVIEEAEVTYWGTCADCRAVPEPSSSPAQRTP